MRLGKQKETPWLLGGIREHPTMPDLFIFPFVERIAMLENSPWSDVYQEINVNEHAKRIVEYVNEFKKIDVFKDQFMKQSAYNKFLDKFSLEEKKPEEEEQLKPNFAFSLSFLD